MSEVTYKEAKKRPRKGDPSVTSPTLWERKTPSNHDCDEEVRSLVAHE